MNPTTPEPSYLVSCEHGGNRVPPAYRALFAGHEAVLHTHRGYDAGALSMARQLARALDAPLFAALTTRLLVDLNRSPGHPALFSEFVRGAPRAMRETIFAHHYLPHRGRLADHVGRAVAQGQMVLHIASHSFTPQLGEDLRRADVAFLYDPARPAERALCRRWMSALAQIAPQLQLRRNYPYRGRSDGLCTWLRLQYPETAYCGIELEVNQRHALAGGIAWLRLRRAIAAALLSALDHPLPERARRALFRASARAHPSSPA